MAYSADYERSTLTTVGQWCEVRKSRRPWRPGHVVSQSGLYIDLPSPQKQKRRNDRVNKPSVNEVTAPDHADNKLKSINHREVSLEDTWKVKVYKTFLTIDDEEDGQLRRVLSAPGKLESVAFESVDLTDSVSNSSISEAHSVSTQSIDSTAASVHSLASGSDDEFSSAGFEVRVADAIGVAEFPPDADHSEWNGHDCGSLLEAANAVDGEEKCDIKKASKTTKRNQRKRAKGRLGKSSPEMPTDVEKTRIATRSNVQLKAPSTDAVIPVSTRYTAADRAKFKHKFIDVFRNGRSAASTSGGSALAKSSIGQEQLGILTPEQLAKFDCNSHRPLVSIHGDIFDVSGCPQKYGPNGFQCTLSGKDITWSIISGSCKPDDLDCFHDIFKADEKVLFDRLLPVLCKALFELECKHGKPVGRLSVFEDEESLPPPPLETMADCVVM